ncbi:MAG: type IV toxin-antitoxin system AbiEi family antitoxin domain-containing protein [Candidatus Edwardsbacteria bacterium]|nr:type IV toxin-antitoxin system AbiEi family antitoxin domain-containing protein [Candidatus Edwardsbacteria bacterium]MBU1576763.1 type IV toxin-antitoxin system AbiEi family antitoxin domain-containing protein [Candidatus Edwardsbacteria bacterium]
MQISKYKILYELLGKRSVISISDLNAHNIPREYLSRLYKQGKLEKVGRGVYSFPNVNKTENYAYAHVSRLVPKGVVCLISALRFNNFTTQLPWQIWVAIDEKARRPNVDNRNIKYIRYSGKAFTEGVEEHIIEGVNVRVYSPAKTVADCFKYRNKIGLDVALEALKEGRRARKFTADELTKYARIDRVLNVIRPYMEAVF